MKNSINISGYLRQVLLHLPEIASLAPWEVTDRILEIITERIKLLDSHYKISNKIAIHKDAKIEEGCVIKSPAIISAHCFVGAHAYLRGGVFLQNNVTIGPGSEIKSSVIFNDSALAHFNFIGDSIIGSNVNFEAGAVIANHFNERSIKTIFVKINNETESIPTQKFGALVGDGSRIGANAVLSPGTIMSPHSIVKRLELIEQCPVT
jgi:NDP-sugar pyrophosphorylase family protein